MKKTFLIFAVGAMGLTIVNAQQPRMDRMDRSHQEITHQLSDGVQLADLPSEVKEKIDDMIGERDAQLVNIDRASGGDGYELTFRNGDRAWKQKFSKDGRTDGSETRMDTDQRRNQTGTQSGQTQMGTQGGQQTGTQGGQTQGQTQTQQRTQGTQTQTGQTQGTQQRTQGTQTEQGQQRTQLEGSSRIQNRDLPRNIRTTIGANRDDKDAQIMSIERGTRDGQDNFDVTFNKDNRTYTRTYGADGKEVQMSGTQGGQTGTQRQGTTGGQTQTGGTTGGQTQTGGTTGGQTRTGTGTTGGQTQTGGTTGGQTQTGGTTGGQTQTGGTTGGQTRTGTGTTGGQTQTGGTTGGQTQTGGTTGGQTQTGGTTGGQTQTGGTTGGQTQTGGTTGGQTQAGQAAQRIPLEGARRMETKDMPRNIQNTIDQNTEDRGAEITSIQRGTRSGQDNYDITFRKDNRTWTRSYDREGKVIPERRDD